MNLLEKLRLFNRELVKENVRLTKIYNKLVNEAVQNGENVDEEELDEGLGGLIKGGLIGGALGAAGGALAGDTIKGSKTVGDATLKVGKAAEDAEKAAEAVKAADAAAKAAEKSSIDFTTAADGTSAAIANDSVAANVAKAKLAADKAQELKGVADASAKNVSLSDKALATIGKHADWKGGAIAGATLGGTVGAFSDDDDRRVEEQETDLDANGFSLGEDEDGTQSFEDFVSGSQKLAKEDESGEYNGQAAQEQDDTGYVGPIRMSGEQLFSEGDEDDSSSETSDSATETPADSTSETPEISDEEFFEPTMNQEPQNECDSIDEGDADVYSFFREDEMNEAKSIPAGKFFGLVNEEDATSKEASDFFNENDDDNDNDNDDENDETSSDDSKQSNDQKSDDDITTQSTSKDKTMSSYVKEKSKAQTQPKPEDIQDGSNSINELEDKDMMDYNEFFNEDPNTTDTADKSDSIQTESLRKFKRRR